MSRRFFVSVFLSDLASLAIALSVAVLLVFGTANRPSLPTGSSLWPFIGLMTMGATLGSWVSHRSWASTVPRPTYGRAVTIVGFASAFAALGVVVLRVYWSRPVFAYTVAIWLALAIAHRVFRRRRPWRESMVVITAEKQLVDDLIDASHTNVIAHWKPSEQPSMVIEDQGISIVVDLRWVLSESMAQFVSSSSMAGLTLRPMVDVYEEHTGRLPMAHVAEGWELNQPVNRSNYAPVKRVLDFALVVITAPVWLVISACVWVAVRLDSPGFAMYHQKRVGRGGRMFTLHKFRTMVHDAEADGPRFATADDPRITRVGRFLRRFRLDEVPQLWNVLKGDLSLVGPRPERPHFVRKFTDDIPFYEARHLIRPGVTGWAQVNYGYADDVAETVEKLTYDLYYVKHSSLWLDLHILGMSVWTVLTGSGAR